MNFNYLLKRILKIIIKFDIIFQFIFFIALIPISLPLFPFIYSKKRNRFVFGPDPILNNKHWALALRNEFDKSETWVYGYYKSINCKSDFNVVYQIRFNTQCIYIFFKSLFFFDIYVIPFSGGFLSRSVFKRFESLILKVLNKKTICIPYGADFYQYSMVNDFKRRHTLIGFYNQLGINEESTKRNVFHWAKYADVIIPGYLVEGLSRWDTLPYTPIVIDTHNYPEKVSFNLSKGKNHETPIKIIHTPNHRIVKGTEYIIDVIKKLKQEGFFIDFILLEKIQNNKVREILTNSDILIDQLYSGYALSAIEGLSSGCVVLSNITRSNYEDLMRTFSYLNECPIVSVDNFDLYKQLKLLLENPKLRKELAILSQKYANKYHSYNSFNILMKKVLEYFSGDVSRSELFNFYHPLNESNLIKLKIPLKDNKII